MRWLSALAFAFLLAAPASAQYVQPRADSGQMQMYDHTFNPGGALGNVGALSPNAGLQGYSSTPTTPPQPPAPTALWTFGQFTAWDCVGATMSCNSVAPVTCSGSACPTSSCSIYCVSAGLAPPAYGSCPVVGSTSTVGPASLGYTFYNTCGA